MTEAGFNVAITEQDLVLFQYRDTDTDFTATLTPDAARELGQALLSRGEKARAVKTANAKPEREE